MHGAQAQGPAPASLGATLLGGGGTRFRVWAPARRLVEVVLEGGAGAPAVFPLRPQPGGYHQGDVPGAQAGTTYRYRLDEDLLRPDPASRFQPEGPHGPSQVIDPDTFRWSDSGWRGLDAAEQVYYELHIGTFTAEGTWRAAEEQLPELSQLGVTALEVMPVAEFAGAFGWGYDGVDMFAPYHRYGTPDDFRSFVDRAHGHGLGVILDVVYNHLGPDGNYLPDFSDSYFTDAYEAEWGDPLNFHGPGSAPVREFFITNAAYWIREFHLDGLRLDATQSVHDIHSGPAHILAEVTRAARAAAKGRSIVVVAENEPQHAELVRPEEEGGMEMDGVWNDDFHHSAIVALTGRTEAYYHDYLGTPQELVSSARWGYLYQGQHYAWQKKRRGRLAFDLSPFRFVHYLQNHDQVANSGRGDRIHRLTSPGRLRAMTAVLLLGQNPPLLFMGQEFAAESPFLYFADHKPELAAAVREGRREFLEQFPSLQRANLPDPADPATVAECKLDFTDRERNAHVYRLHRELLTLRRTDPVLAARRDQRPEGAVLGGSAFLLRYFGPLHDHRLLVVNLGREMRFSPAPEPLLAPPNEAGWKLIWSSEDERYGGGGAVEPEQEDGRWHLPAECAMLLAPASRSAPRH
ncbi:MAG TPA: malto-oligosyltrehalose trehalohydrolase [Longimicrobiaceae bacterium]